MIVRENHFSVFSLLCKIYNFNFCFFSALDPLLILWMLCIIFQDHASCFRDMIVMLMMMILPGWHASCFFFFAYHHDCCFFLRHKTYFVPHDMSPFFMNIALQPLVSLSYDVLISKKLENLLFRFERKMK